ncbi:MAG: M48 family metalloprotease [Candidatus Competibacteraceae bacterium]
MPAHAGCLLLLWSGLAFPAATDTPPNPRAQVQFYITTYSLADPREQPLVARAYWIFEELRRVAEPPARRQPQLKIVNSPGDPWAIALPDGFIVLSRRAVELAYQGVGQPEGDARLAFILGHELAHLAKDDFWHLEVSQALAGDPEPAAVNLRRLLEQQADVQGAAVEPRRRALRLKEAEADDRGFLYAGLAGYRVDTLLGEPGAGKADFFHDWLSQTQTRLDPAHPDPAERATLLRVQLDRLQEKLEFFYTGVRLTHFGAYADAEYFLREFQTVFPAREVHNNLGYGYLQRARRELPPALAYRYCLPTLLDTTTRAATIVQRGGSEETPALTAEARTLLPSVNYFLTSVTIIF